MKMLDCLETIHYYSNSEKVKDVACKQENQLKILTTGNEEQSPADRTTNAYSLD